LKFEDIMTTRHFLLTVLIITLMTGINSTAQLPNTIKLEQGTLIKLGAEPFHLKAAIYAGRDQKPSATVEIDWATLNKYRRVIQSKDFSQTLIVNSEKVHNESGQYFPGYLNVILAAMVDPTSLLGMMQPDDIAWTKAGGQAQENGSVCFQGKFSGCFSGDRSLGLRETIKPLGTSVEFTDYKKFHSERIARRINVTTGNRSFYRVIVEKLDELKQGSDELFEVNESTPANKILLNKFLTDDQLRAMLDGPAEIIWPQIPDKVEEGTTSYYVAIDQKGVVRDVTPIDVNIERANDSAVRQIKRWKFKPYLINGIPAQVEGRMSFHYNTRQYGPKDILSDEEVRILATNQVQPIMPEGSVSKGTTYDVWISVDSDGIIIEKLFGSGPKELWAMCDKALMQWHFAPIMENGQPRPYRAHVIFKF
jgi:hypothetical protein